MKCLNCEKELEGKKQYCDDRCRMAYTRRMKAGEQPEQIEPEQPTRTFDFKLTRTDKEFEASDPGFYNFDKREFDKECFSCDTKFTTHLSLLKFCSLKCKKKFHDAFKPGEGL